MFAVAERDSARPVPSNFCKPPPMRLITFGMMPKW
ncbi:Uncharacterised protein [Vibrio cholerae]|nr:Uncharacterised protein [Vibrio cholerae]